jgi:GR25 family glycosyltransferase involved in LPS biosynthesis
MIAVCPGGEFRVVSHLQRPVRRLIDAHSARTVRAWDAMLRDGVAARLRSVGGAHVICVEREEDAARHGSLVLRERTIVSAAGIARLQGGDENWWKERDAFADVAEELRCTERHESLEAALNAPQAAAPQAAPAPPSAHKIWLYDYEPRWLAASGVRIWRWGDIPSLARTRSGEFANLRQMYRAMMLEILYEFGGCVLQADQGARDAEGVPLLREASWATARSGRAARPFDPMLLYWMEMNKFTRDADMVPESVVGMVVYVNLDRCADKRDRMDRRLFLPGGFGTRNISRLPAVEGACLDTARMVMDGKLQLQKYMELIDRSCVVSDASYPFTEGTVGCAESHYRIWERVVAQNVVTLVLEDDVDMYPTFESALANCRFRDFDGQWDLFYCGYIQKLVKGSIYTNLRALSYIDGTYALIINPSTASELLKNAYPMYTSIDIYIRDVAKIKKLHVFGMGSMHVKTVSVFEDKSVSSIARVKVDEIVIPRMLYICCDAGCRASEWIAMHADSGWRVRLVREPMAELPGAGGVFVDARELSAPDRPIDRLLPGVRGFVSYNKAGDGLSPAIYGFEKNNPVFAPGAAASFRALESAWARDKSAFLRSMKILHQCVFIK